ncbi:MAG: hypothetical protein DRN99_06690 [Thermoproteota archaeon]|nr:MAG: hypothetical protein DRN99_06690 [Candidatus Korarchaeota archaeon]
MSRDIASVLWDIKPVISPRISEIAAGRRGSGVWRVADLPVDNRIFRGLSVLADSRDKRLSIILTLSITPALWELWESHRARLFKSITSKLREHGVMFSRDLCNVYVYSMQKDIAVITLESTFYHHGPPPAHIRIATPGYSRLSTSYDWLEEQLERLILLAEIITAVITERLEEAQLEHDVEKGWSQLELRAHVGKALRRLSEQRDKHLAWIRRSLIEAKGWVSGPVDMWTGNRPYPPIGRLTSFFDDLVSETMHLGIESRPVKAIDQIAYILYMSSANMELILSNAEVVKAAEKNSSFFSGLSGYYLILADALNSIEPRGRSFSEATSIESEGDMLLPVSPHGDTWVDWGSFKRELEINREKLIETCLALSRTLAGIGESIREKKEARS